jgi:GH25 family lysozyme M1 (1,4-beta-N-acetylmuramidase)
MSAMGVDLSNFQTIRVGEWAGLDFGFVKATEGLGFIDSTLRARWATMRGALPCQGAYHFLHPGESGRAQAEFMWAVLAPLGVHKGDMIMCDSEITAGVIKALRGKRMHAGPNRQDVATRAPFTTTTVGFQTKAFLDRMRELAPAGVRIGVYTNLTVAQSLGNCTNYPLWIARPGSSWPSSVFPWVRGPKTNPFWQFDFTPRDQDAYDGTRRELLDWLGLTITPAPDPEPPAPSDDEDEDMPQLNTGTNAVTAIACTGGTKSFIGLLADPGQEGVNTVVLRVAVFSNSKGWSQIVDKVTIGTGKDSKQSVGFTEPDVAGVAITRISNGAADLTSVSYNW